MEVGFEIEGRGKRFELGAFGVGCRRVKRSER